MLKFTKLPNFQNFKFASFTKLRNFQNTVHFSQFIKMKRKTKFEFSNLTFNFSKFTNCSKYKISKILKLNKMRNYHIFKFYNFHKLRNCKFFKKSKFRNLQNYQLFKIREFPNWQHYTIFKSSNDLNYKITKCSNYYFPIYKTYIFQACNFQRKHNIATFSKF